MTRPTPEQTSIRQLQLALKEVWQPDFQRLRRQLLRISKKPQPATLHKLAESIQASTQHQALRETNLPEYNYPPELPVSEKHEDIVAAIKNHQIILVCGETGSGKTTQLPKICLQAGRGLNGFIGHTQPRRLAARSIANRLAEELNTEIGLKVGFKVRFQDNSNIHNYVKVMTDGILLSEMQQDRWLNQYDTIIIDEAHERSLNIDFLLGYLKQLCRRRSDLKLIITSATIDAEGISAHFDNAPIIEVSGRTWPVEMRYLCSDENEASGKTDIYQSVSQALDELAADNNGDTLVFLPGEREIRELSRKLRHLQGRTDILPLYARLQPKEQQRVFQTGGKHKVVLSTNVAETSLTVPGIRNVIDTGLVRMSRYSWRSKVQRLPIEKTSQASANQRAGRCGRIGPGICIRLYDEEDFETRSAFTDPEILRTNLATVLLQMAHLRLGKVADFPFINQPDPRLVRDGERLLQELHAIDQQGQLTRSGKQLAVLPIDPRLGRMLLAARDFGASSEVLIITTAIAAGDPRERPMDKQQAADEAHASYADKQSDFLSLLNLWNHLHQQSNELSHSAFRRYCLRSFINFRRYREWCDLHRQLKLSLKQQGIRIGDQSAEADAIHQSLLTGLLDQIGMKADKDKYKGEYEGVRNRRFKIHPGSVLAKKQPKWIMAAEMVETTHLYARLSAGIQPQWIENAAAHLLKHDHSEPHWQPKQGRVGGFVKLSLYGLVIVPRRRINYGPVDSATSRQMFIQHALVQGELESPPPVIKKNSELIASLELKEAKIRRRDILIDEEMLYAFYDQHIPADVNNSVSFQRWLKSGKDDSFLRFDEQQITRSNASDIKAADFPDNWEYDGLQLPLHYDFEPGSNKDGVTLIIPLPVLPQITPDICEWLVPGLLEEKILALLRSLPKAVRKQFVPAPDYALAVRQSLTTTEGTLTQAITDALFRMTGNKIPTDAWNNQTSMADHLRMRFEVTDEGGKVIATGRDLLLLKSELEQQLNNQKPRPIMAEFEQQNLTDWSFGELPESIQCNEAGYQIRRYPALVDNGITIDLKLHNTVEDAIHANKAGLIRLFQLKLKKEVSYLQKSLPDMASLCLIFHPLADCKTLTQDIIRAGIWQTFLQDKPVPRDESEFRQCLETHSGKFVANTIAICNQLPDILTPWKRIQTRLKGNLPLATIEAASDIKKQLNELIYPNFLQQTNPQWLREFPRYLKAIERRLDNLNQAPDKDRIKRIEIEPLAARLDNFSIEQINNNPDLTQYRWHLEELRVSLFAQELGTKKKVSPERLNKLWK